MPRLDASQRYALGLVNRPRSVSEYAWRQEYKQFLLVSATIGAFEQVADEWRITKKRHFVSGVSECLLVNAT